jgi:hypothetical protein
MSPAAAGVRLGAALVAMVEDLDGRPYAVPRRPGKRAPAAAMPREVA